MSKTINRTWRLPADAPSNWNPVAELHRQQERHGERGEFFVRLEAFKGFCYWIPNVEALQAAGQYAPLLSVGAGTAFAESLWRLGGIEIVAVDAHPLPRNQYHWAKAPFMELLQGDESVIPQYPDYTLVLCCPPGDIPMASTCLDFYRGKFLIVVGQRRGSSGVHGDRDFHKTLDTHWDLIQTVDLPNWRGDYIDMRIFRRR